MKKMTLAVLFITLAAGLFAQEKNLVDAKWRHYRNSKDTVIDAKTGIITCKNSTNKAYSGVVQTIVLNQKTPKAITFSAESKAKDVVGTLPSNYCLYVDIRFEDGTHVFGQTAVFKGGTHDWEKTEGTYTPNKPIKHVAFYVLLRLVTGEASFRNVTFTEAK